MMNDWWYEKKNVSVVVDNDGWVLPHCEKLVDEISRRGDISALFNDYQNILEDGIAIFLSCHKQIPLEVLNKNKKNLIIHASNLPEGRGWSPITWQVLNGLNKIPICLFEAVEEIDAGPVVYREYIELNGSELVEEIREILAIRCIDMCIRYISEPTPPHAIEQQGETSYWPRRTPEDSKLDPEKSLQDQFNLLRIVDNERYPAYFELNGQRYLIKIFKQ